MLKSCLLFSGKNIRNNRELILQKKIMALILEGKVKNREDIGAYCVPDEEAGGRNGLTDQVISGLRKRKFIDLDDDGRISLSEKTSQEIAAFSADFDKARETFVEEILAKVKEVGFVTEAVAARRNIRECVDYYFKTESLAILGYDDRAEQMPEKIKELACRSLHDGETTGNLIIEAIGRVLASPSESQRDFIESYARAMLTSRIIGRDSLLRSFKATVMGKKSFMLDTDVVLNCVTKNTRRGRAYRNMIGSLLACGCNLTVPQEVIEEAYDHAEAATKRYNFHQALIETGDLGCMAGMRMNVFVEDYMSGTSTGDGTAWKRYIQNYFDPDYGVTLMTNVVKDALGDKIRYDLELNQQVKKDSDEYGRLYDAVYQETKLSPNAQYREAQKNEEIAAVDTMMYLETRERNGRRKAQGEKTKGVLINDHYILTSSTRAHACAMELDIECDVVCSPRALMAYMAECGLLEDKDLSVIGLMDNPFLVYVARNSWDDLKNIVEVGVDVRGRSLVRLKMDVQHQVQTILTTKDPDVIREAYSEIRQKGYAVNENVRSVLERADSLEARLAETATQLSEAKVQLNERDDRIKGLEANLAKARYEERARGKSANKKDKNRSVIKGVKRK